MRAKLAKKEGEESDRRVKREGVEYMNSKWPTRLVVVIVEDTIIMVIMVTMVADITAADITAAVMVASIREHHGD